MWLAILRPEAPVRVRRRTRNDPAVAGPSRPYGAARRAAWRISSRLQSHPQASRAHSVMGVAGALVTNVTSCSSVRPSTTSVHGRDPGDRTVKRSCADPKVTATPEPMSKRSRGRQPQWVGPLDGSAPRLRLHRQRLMKLRSLRSVIRTRPISTLSLGASSLAGVTVVIPQSAVADPCGDRCASVG